MTDKQNEIDISIFVDADALEEVDLKAAAFLKYTEGLEKAKATKESIRLRNQYLYGDAAEPKESDEDADFVLTQIARNVDLLEESFIPDKADPLLVIPKSKSCPLFSESDDQDFLLCGSQRSSSCSSWDYDTQFIELASNADMIESLLDSNEKNSENTKITKNSKKGSSDSEPIKTYKLYTIDEEINIPDEEMKENNSDISSQSKDDIQNEASSPIIVRSQFRKHEKISRKRLFNSKSKENNSASKDTFENNKKIKQNEVEDIKILNQNKPLPAEVDLNTQEEFFNQFSEFMLLDTQSDVTNSECSQKKLSQDLKNECIENDILKQNNVFDSSEIDKTNDSKNVAFDGFMTASNKKINVSKSALKNVENIFNDIKIDDLCMDMGSDDEFNEKNYSIIKSDDKKRIPSNVCDENFNGFMTASNKKINVSNDALQRAKCIFQNNNIYDNNREDSDCLFILDKKLEKFSIANNKNGEASNRALKEVKSIYESNIYNKKKLNTFCSTEKICKNVENRSDIKNENFPVFKTASNKDIKVSRENLIKAKQLFDDVDEASDAKNISHQCSTLKGFDNKNQNNIFKGSTTASNKNIEVSEKSLQVVKRMFEEDNEMNEFLKNENLESISNTNVDNCVSNFGNFQGFTTASNKKIEISDDALQTVKHMFKDIDGENYKNIHSEFPDRFDGFTTASNKKIKISDQAIQKVKNMFENIKKDEPNISDCNKNIKNLDFENITVIDSNVSESFKGFTTASNKKIKISDQAIQKVKNMFENIEKDEPKISDRNKNIRSSDFDNLIATDSNVNEIFKGFTTASNKNIKISENSLQKVKDMFKNIDSDDNKIHEDRNKLIDEKNSKAQQSLDHNRATDNFLDFDTKASNEVSKINESENFSCNKDIEPPMSPILQFKGKRKRKTFRAPLKQNSESNNEIKRRKVDEESQLKLEKSKVPAVNFSLGDVLNEKIKNKNKMIPLKLLYKNKNNINICNDDISTLSNFNFMDFIFNGSRCDLVMESGMSQMTVNDIVDLFMSSNEINKKLIPNGWVINHIKWIMWKLASYEKRFSECFSNEPVLKITNVLKQLKYRYDRELYGAQRPILRKVLEKDDVSTKRMVLCVSNIVKINIDATTSNNRDNIKSEYELELTDGWYSVMTIIDSVISSQIVKGKIVVGTKLMIYGAELLNCPQGVAPLEDNHCVRLKIWANSCRRCLPWIKLGLYAKNTGPMNLSLGESKTGGGPLALIRFIPITVYHMFFLNKSNDGSIVMRSQKLQEIYNAQIEIETQEKLEQLYVQAENDILSIEKDKKNEFIKISSLKACSSTEDFVSMLEKAADPQEFMSSLTTSQQKAVQQFINDKHYSIRQKIDSRVQELIHELGLHQKQNVRVLKTRIMTLDRGEPVFALLTIWRPDDTTIEMIKEGLCFDATNITPTGIKNGEFQVSAGKRSSFQEVTSRNFSNIEYHKNCVQFEEFYSPYFSPKFNEVDIVGIVIAIEPKMAKVTDNIKFQTVYMVDKNMTYIAIVFWGGIVKTGFQKLIEEDQCLACLNLQHRTRTLTRKIRQLYATEFSMFTRHCKKSHIDEAICDIEKFMKQIDFQFFLTNCKNKLQILKHDTPKIGTSKNLLPEPKYKFDKNDIDEYSVSDLDFESTFVDTSKNDSISNIFNDKSDFFNSKNSFNTSKINISSIINENKLNNSKNVSSIEARINKLKMYGEPPPLSPIALDVTNRVKRTFIPPFIQNLEKSESSSNISETVIDKDSSL